MIRRAVGRAINRLLRPVGVEVRAIAPCSVVGDYKALTPWIVQKYLDSCNVRILQIATGPTYTQKCYHNWLNSDIANPPSWNHGVWSIFMDLKEDFSLPSNSFDYVFSQQGIEHFTYEQGANILRECSRVLKPGGKMRIETPNICYFIENYLGNDKPVGPSMAQFAKEFEAPPTHLTALNSIFLQWGHWYVYDVETLEELCRLCGFDKVHEVEMCKTDIAPFREALAFNPCSEADPFYKESSFALEMEKSGRGS